MTSTYVPWLYDAMTHGPVQGDIGYYVRKAKHHGGPVLELGAGSGRTLVPIAQLGLDVHGVELDRGMLRTCERKIARLAPETAARITLHEGDMRDFAIEQRFALVQIPFRAFLHNLGRDDQLACLAAVKRHLAPGGALAFNVFHPSLTFMSARQPGQWYWCGDTVLADGRCVVRSEASRYDTAAQRVSSRLRYELLDEAGRVVDRWIQRLELAYLYPGDLRQLLTEAGFVGITIEGGPKGEPFDADGDELFVSARVP